MTKTEDCDSLALLIKRSAEAGYIGRDTEMMLVAIAERDPLAAAVIMAQGLFGAMVRFEARLDEATGHGHIF